MRIERLERAMPLGCEELGSSSGGGEWAWWSGAWWVKTKMRMNSANRRKVHWAISQWLGKTSERNRVYEEKTSDTEDDGARRRQKLEREIDQKMSWRARNEQESVEKRDDKFQKRKQGGGRVHKHTWFFFWVPDLELGCPVLAWNMLPGYPWCVSLNSPKLDLKKHLACVSCRFHQLQWYRNCIGSLECVQRQDVGSVCMGFSLEWTPYVLVALKRALLRTSSYALSGNVEPVM